MSWIFFALLAPLSYGASNLIDRFLVEKRIQYTVGLVVLGGFSTTLAGFIIFLVHGAAIFPIATIVILLLAGVIFEIATIPWYRAISLEDTSRLVPLFQLVSVFVLILSYLFLGERLNGRQLFAFMSILIGSILLSVQRLEFGSFRLRKAAWYMLLSSFLIAVPLVLYKFAVVPDQFLTSLMYEFFGSGIGSAILLLIPSIRRGSMREARAATAGTWTIVGMNDAIYVAGKFVGFYATTIASVSLVSVLGGIQPLYVFIAGLILSAWFPHLIKEDTRRETIIVKLVAIVLTFVGVWYLSF